MLSLGELKEPRQLYALAVFADGAWRSFGGRVYCDGPRFSVGDGGFPDIPHPVPTEMRDEPKEGDLLQWCAATIEPGGKPAGVSIDGAEAVTGPSFTWHAPPWEQHDHRVYTVTAVGANEPWRMDR